MKRLFDIVVSAAMLFFLMPLIAVVVLVVLLVLGRPVLYRQTRLGYQGKPFTMLKFRTMTESRDRFDNYLSDEERLGRVGHLLRASSLDELPALINVVKGEMSLVGPRPLLEEYRNLYNTEQWRRHEVLPGITGWAQINGRNSLDWEEKFRLDVWYVDNRSFWLDLKILVATIGKVFRREGISQDGQATMEKFSGNKESR